ncbi:UNVERIFIED_CONTAM: hypothetical protein FKN15_038908 [Acipenser sinensis]
MKRIVRNGDSVPGEKQFYRCCLKRNTNKKYNVMAFNSGDKVNFSTWTQAKMERDLSNKRMFQDEEAPETGAGSEFGKKLREVSRRKKFGIVPREFKLEDQPWLLRVNGKAGRKGERKRTGGGGEGEERRGLRRGEEGVRIREENEGVRRGERRGEVLFSLTELHQRAFLDGDSKPKKAAEDEKSKTKTKKKTTKKRKKKKGGSDSEAIEDSDDGDFEGLEVDYMSDESSLCLTLCVCSLSLFPSGIDEASDSSEESEEEKKEEKKEDEEEEEDEEEGKKTPVQQEKKKKKGTGAGRRGAPLRVPSERGSAPSPVGTRLRSESRRNEAPLRVPSGRGSARSPVGTRLRTESRRNEAPLGVPSERGSARSPLGTRLRTESPRDEAPHGVPSGRGSARRIDEASDSSEESEEEKKEEKKEDEEEEEDEEEGKKTPVQQEKKKKKGTGAGRRGAPLGVPSERGTARSPVGTRLRSESRRNEAPHVCLSALHVALFMSRSSCR